MDSRIIAKDTERDYVLVGGLGDNGLGQWWFPATEQLRLAPGFDTAPEQRAITSNDWTWLWQHLGQDGEDA